MEMIQLELQLINCIKNNIEQSGEEVPDISGDTVLQDGIPGFDSLRAIEVLIELETELDCELPPEKVFTKKSNEQDTIEDMAKAIMNIINQE